MAKSLGAEVTAVDNTGKQDFVRSNGADECAVYIQSDAGAKAILPGLAELLRSGSFGWD